ncbi:MAG: hypothetical protein JW769_01625 [Parachlamydiales bacterium]|nr:hypothetical protein [Parachlamydiales bacterium]
MTTVGIRPISLENLEKSLSTQEPSNTVISTTTRKILFATPVIFALIGAGFAYVAAFPLINAAIIVGGGALICSLIVFAILKKPSSLPSKEDRQWDKIISYLRTTLNEENKEELICQLSEHFESLQYKVKVFDQQMLESYKKVINELPKQINLLLQNEVSIESINAKLREIFTSPEIEKICSYISRNFSSTGTKKFENLPEDFRRVIQDLIEWQKSRTSLPIAATRSNPLVAQGLPAPSSVFEPLARYFISLSEEFYFLSSDHQAEIRSTLRALLVDQIFQNQFVQVCINFLNNIQNEDEKRYRAANIFALLYFKTPDGFTLESKNQTITRSILSKISLRQIGEPDLLNKITTLRTVVEKFSTTYSEQLIKRKAAWIENISNLFRPQNIQRKKLLKQATELKEWLEKFSAQLNPYVTADLTKRSRSPSRSSSLSTKNIAHRFLQEIQECLKPHFNTQTNEFSFLAEAQEQLAILQETTTKPREAVKAIQELYTSDAFIKFWCAIMAIATMVSVCQTDLPTWKELVYPTGFLAESEDQSDTTFSNHMSIFYQSPMRLSMHFSEVLRSNKEEHPILAPYARQCNDGGITPILRSSFLQRSSSH